MSWQPLLDQPFIINWHAFAAIAAIVFGAAQLAGPKGTLAHRVKAHRYTMVQLCILALIVTGAFTLWPGRVMHQVVFG